MLDLSLLRNLQEFLNPAGISWNASENISASYESLSEPIGLLSYPMCFSYGFGTVPIVSFKWIRQDSTEFFPT